MALFKRRRLFEPQDDGRFAVHLAPDAKQGILSLAEELEQLQSTDRPETRRLFPTAYPDDPERDAGYQIFARDQLIERIWADEFDGDPRTIDLYVRRLRMQIETDAADPRWLQTVWGVGYRMSDEV